MLTLKRTNSEDPDFLSLVRALDQELRIRDGDDHVFYAQFNKVDLIRHAIVAYWDHTAVACGAVKRYNDQTMEVKRMFVADAFRGKGIASRVLAELEHWTRELQFARCILETGKNQPEAIGLYHKNGYRLIPNYDQYALIENSVCFEKIL